MHEVNLLAVLVAGIVPMIIGALWYGPLFGKRWLELMETTEEEVREGFNPLKTHGLGFLLSLVTAYVLAQLLAEYAGGAMVGVHVGADGADRIRAPGHAPVGRLRGTQGGARVAEHPVQWRRAGGAGGGGRFLAIGVSPPHPGTAVGWRQGEGRRPQRRNGLLLFVPWTIRAHESCRLASRLAITCPVSRS